MMLILFTKKNYRRIRFKVFQVLLISFLMMGGCQARSNFVNPSETIASPTQLAATDPPGRVTPTAAIQEDSSLNPPATVEPRLAWFYKPPEDTDLFTIANYFQFGILSNGNEPERDALRQMNMRGPFLQYLRFDVIQDPGSCTRQPWKNQVANQPGDYCRIAREHPDWFLRDQDGKLLENPYGGENFAMMDPGNVYWRAFWLDRARQTLDEGSWDGIFLDNVEVTFSFREQREQIPTAYPDEASYQKAVQEFLKYIYQDLHSQGKLLFANLVARKDDTDWTSYLDSLDGAMHEGWAIDWPNGYRSAETWEKHLRLAEDTQAMGKTIILVSQGKEGQEKLQRFSYASYLLVMQGAAYFRFANSDHYREAWLYPNYQLDLGKPLGNRYQVGEVWRRDFANGWVEVDPVHHKAEIRSTSSTTTRIVISSTATSAANR
jgi:hypothetical protein